MSIPTGLCCKGEIRSKRGIMGNMDKDAEIKSMLKRVNDDIERKIMGELWTQTSANSEASNLTYEKLKKTYDDFRAQFEFKLGEHRFNLLDFDVERPNDNTVLLLRKRYGDERYEPLKPFDVIIIYIKEKKALVYNPKPKPDIELPPYMNLMDRWRFSYMPTFSPLAYIFPEGIDRTPDEFPDWLGDDSDFFEEFTEIDFK